MYYTTNTFGCNELKVSQVGIYLLEEIIDKCSICSKEGYRWNVIKAKPRFVALDIGPIGEMLEPMGTLIF